MAIRRAERELLMRAAIWWRFDRLSLQMQLSMIHAADLRITVI